MKMAVWIACSLLLSPGPLHAQAAPSASSHGVIRIAAASDKAPHPAIVLVHARDGYQAGKDFYDRYADRLASDGYHSIPHAIHIYAGAGHGFDGDPASPDARDALQRTADFFDAHLKR